jgi:hypothetical protein
MNSLITSNKATILKLAQQHGIRNVRLFGSMVRDDATSESDVDFLVDLEEGRDLFDLGELLMDLQDLLHRKVDLVTESSLNTKIGQHILREAISL